MNTHRKQKKQLTAAILAALLAMPAYGHALTRPPEYVYYNGKPMVEIQFLVQGEELENLVDKAGYTLSPSLIQPVKSSTAYWTGLLGPNAKNGQPWQVFVTTEAGDQNASATTKSVIVKNRNGKLTPVNFVAQQLQNGKNLIRMTEELAKSDNHHWPVFGCGPQGGDRWLVGGYGYGAADQRTGGGFCGYVPP